MWLRDDEATELGAHNIHDGLRFDAVAVCEMFENRVRSPHTSCSEIPSARLFTGLPSVHTEKSVPNTAGPFTMKLNLATFMSGSLRPLYPTNIV